MEVVSTVCRCKFCHQLGGRETFRVVDSLKDNQTDDHLKRHSYQSRLITGSLPRKIKQHNHNLLGNAQSDGTSVSEQVSKTMALDRVKSIGVGEVEAGEKVSIQKEEHEAISKRRKSSATEHNSQKSLRRITQERPRNAVTSKTSIVQKVKEHALQDPLLSARWSHCFQLYSKFQDANEIECRQCQRAVGLSGYNKDAVPFRLLKHVTCFHLEKSLYVCRRCKQPCKSYDTFVSHMRAKHNTNKIRGEYDDYSNKFHQEIISMLSECFDWSYRVERKEQERTDNRSNGKIDSVTDRALVLVKNCLQNRRVFCAECGYSLKVTDGKAICEKSAIRHALTHLGKFLFHCLRCSQRTNTENAVKNHLKRNHAIAVAIVGTHYTDSTAYHQNEIIETLERCFGRSAICTGKVESCEVQLRLRNRADVNQLLATRKLHCRYLFIKSGSPSRIDCRLCSNKVLCSPGFITSALRHHVEASHLKKPLYRCRHCFENINEHSSVRKHLKTTHGFNEIKGNYYDLSSDYHQEIMSLFTECFDHESGKGDDASKVEEKVANALVVEETSAEMTGQNNEVSVIPKYSAKAESNQSSNSVTANRPFEKIDSIETQARALLENRIRDGRVFCAQCVSPTRVAIGGAIDLSAVIGHASFHMRKALFECQLCTCASFTKIGMENHLEINHGVANAEGYTDLTAKYRQEILDTLGRCFGGKENLITKATMM